MMINRRRVCGGKSLPYDAEIEYLESTGTQWIDTGITGEAGISISLKFIFKTGSVGNDKYIVGSSGGLSGYKRVFLGTYTSRWILGVADTNNFANGITNNTMYDCEASWLKDNQYLKVNGQKIIDTHNNTIYTTNRNLFLFTRNHYEGQVVYFASSSIIYYCKIFNNNILVRDYIPVRVGTTGYMYDKVSGQLFGNAGTGSFILGPDI